jgi:hypothetical protein
MTLKAASKATPANVTIWIAVITFVCQNIPNVVESADLFAPYTIKVVSFIFDIINQVAAAMAIFYQVKTK